MSGNISERVKSIHRGMVEEIIHSFTSRFHIEEYRIVGSYNDGKEILGDIDIVAIVNQEGLIEELKNQGFKCKVMFGNLVSIEYIYCFTYHQIDVICQGSRYDNHENKEILEFIYNCTTNTKPSKYPSKNKSIFLTQFINTAFRKMYLIQDTITEGKYMSFWLNSFDSLNFGHRVLRNHLISKSKESIMRIQNWDKMLKILDVKSLHNVEDIQEQFVLDNEAIADYAYK